MRNNRVFRPVVPVALTVMAMLVLMPACAPSPTSQGEGVEEMALPMPDLHHVHMNSVDPDAALEWFQKVWPEGTITTYAGFPALEAEMYLLFNKVDEPPPAAWREDIQRAAPQSVFWHIGINTDTTTVADRLEEAGVKLVPLYTTSEDKEGVWRSGLSPYPGMQTAARITDIERREPRPGGFGYMVSPEGALVEASGGPNTEDSFNHVHFYHEAPWCAAKWYVAHLGMGLPTRRDPETRELVQQALPDPCDVEYGDPSWPSLEYHGTIRQPRGSVRYGNGSMAWYGRQCVRGRCGEDQPIVSSLGQLYDHLAFTIPDLDMHFERLQREGVTILKEPYPFGDTRAFMIEDLDHLAIELIERTEM